MTSKATKRKYVIKEVLEDFVLPEGEQEIVQVVSSCGSNLHQVMNSQRHQYLVSMPTKFRRNVWIKRDDFVIVTPIEEGDKVKAEISTILYKEQIKYIKDNNKWPEAFTTGQSDHTTASSTIDEDMLPPAYSDSDYSDDDGEMIIGAGNPNRPPTLVDTMNDESSSDNDSDH